MPLPEAKRRYQPTGSALIALELCERLGAAPAESLERLAEVETGLTQTQAELEVAASGPRASAKLVTLLPVVVLLGAQLLGMRVFNSLNPLTAASITLGALLLFAGRRWSSRILAKAQPDAQDPGAALDAFAAAMNAGLQKGLTEKGMIFNTTKPDSFRDRLRAGGFYKEWKANLGDEAWALLERYSGKLA